MIVLATPIVPCCALQLIFGFARPSAAAPTRHRHIWDVMHTTLGRAAMLIGIANVALGVTIFSEFFDGEFSAWAGWCAAALASINLTQYILDRQVRRLCVAQE